MAVRFLATVVARATGWFSFPAARHSPLLADHTQADVVIGAAGAHGPVAMRGFEALGPRGQQALRIDFPQSRFFAAFAAFADALDGRFGWVSGRHNPSNARAAALWQGLPVMVTLRPKGCDPRRAG